jgi:hypothetical protein
MTAAEAANATMNRKGRIKVAWRSRACATPVRTAAHNHDDFVLRDVPTARKWTA